MAATTLPDAKPRQLQIARIRREEEEDMWISGEELHTEGSSDDESHTPHHTPHSATTSAFTSASATSTKECATSTTSTATQIYHQLLERRISAPAHLNRWQTTPKEASEPVILDEPHLTETMRRFSEMGVDLPLSYPHERESSEGLKKVEEQEEVMLWRPKRGSLKLPRIDLDPVPSRVPRQKVTGYL